MNDHADTLRRFLFEHAPLRGEIVHLDASWQNVLQRHDYPPVLRSLLGELCAAAVLLAATLKLNGSLVLQIQGQGPLKLLVVECTGDLALRATAKWEGELPQAGLAALAGAGRFVITLDPREGKQAYQGVVPLEGGSIAEMLQGYMSRSEQLETRLWLAADEHSAGGLLLQKLPQQSAADADAWPRAVQLAETVRREELLQLPAAELVHRLFHEEDIRLFAAQPVQFRCTCSRDNVAGMLRMLGEAEVQNLLAEQGRLEVHCEFCNERYVFDAVDARALFADPMALTGNPTRH